MARILGLDVGEKTIGVAVSDELGWTAQGVKTINRTGKKQDLAEVIRLAENYSVEEIVVGLPKNMNNSLGEQAQKSVKFARALEARLAGIPVKLWDERLSTSAANNVLLAADVSRKKRKRVINTLASVIILQNYLDARAPQ